MDEWASLLIIVMSGAVGYVMGNDAGERKVRQEIADEREREWQQFLQNLIPGGKGDAQRGQEGNQ